MCLTPGGSNPLFSEVVEISFLDISVFYTLITHIFYILLVVLKEYSLIGKIGSFKLQISSSSLDALVVIWYFINIIYK